VIHHNRLTGGSRRTPRTPAIASDNQDRVAVERDPQADERDQAAAKRDIDSAVRNLKRGSAIRNGSLTTALVDHDALGGLLRRIRGVESRLDDAVLDEAA
jgi:hypothetical protein